MPHKDTLNSLSNKLEASEDNLVITITGEVFIHIKRLSGKMKNANSPKDAVEIAIELLLKAEDKDIAVVDKGRVVNTYSLWK